MVSRSLIALSVVLLLAAALFAAETPAEDPKPADFAEAAVLKAISFLPAEQKAQLTPCVKEIAAAARPDAGKPDTLYGFAEKQGETAAKAFAEAFGEVRKGLESGKSAADLKVELGRLARHVLAACQPYRGDKAAFESEARPVFEQKLNEQRSSLKADYDKFQRVADPARFAVEAASRAQAEAKKLAEGGKKAEEVPSAVFSLASNGLADVWLSLLTKPGADGTGDYIGNKSSKKFHLGTCKRLPAEKNQVRFKTREEAIDAGYQPCKVCKP